MTVRTLAGFLIALAVLLMMIALMMSADLLLTVWERLRELGPWAPPVFAAVMTLFAGGTALLGLRMLRGPAAPREPAPQVVDSQSLQQRLDHASEKGVDIRAAEAELDHLNQREAGGEKYLAMFGAASSGKSTLITALLPQHVINAQVTLGTTRGVTHYQGRRGDHLLQIADVPGFGHQPTSELLEAASDEAIRAHLVIYVADGDLDRDDGAHLERLAAFGKPLIVALNKADRYSSSELAQLRQRFDQLLAGSKLVNVSAGGQREVLVSDANGERMETRQRPAQTEELWSAIDQLLAQAELESHRERSSLQLASEKLGAAEAAHRTHAGQALTEKYARRAVIGALAAITPGSDLVIQAALATRFLRELGALYEVPVKEIEIDRFLTLAGDRLKKTTALVLAVTGNAFKAFPGVGTLTGGVIHAAAYGMIFDSLGRSICASLEERKSLDPVFAADQFEKTLDAPVDGRILDYARLALKTWRADTGNDRT